MVISKTGKVFITRAHFALPDYNQTTHIDEMEYIKILATKKSFNIDGAENWDVQGSLLHPNKMNLSWGDDCHAVLDVSVYLTHPSKNTNIITDFVWCTRYYDEEVHYDQEDVDCFFPVHLY